jgi:hypothetical protein
VPSVAEVVSVALRREGQIFVFLKFLHISARCAATSLAVGPIVVYYLVARSGDANALKTAMKFDEALERTAGGFYGLGLLLGVAATLTGSLDLTAPWLLTAYALVVLLIVNNLYLSLRMRALKELASNTTTLRALSRARALTASIAALGLITLALVYTMVAKPTLF